jgi:hypothetical protein
MNSTGRQRLLFKELNYPPKIDDQNLSLFEEIFRENAEITPSDNNIYLHFYPNKEGYKVMVGRSIVGITRFLPDGVRAVDLENKIFTNIDLDQTVDLSHWSQFETFLRSKLEFGVDEFRIVFKRIVDQQNRFRLLLALEIFI